MKELLEEAIANFNERAEEDAKLRKALEGKTRKVFIEITDGTSYHFTLTDSMLKDFGEGDIAEPDIKVTSDEATMTGILKKEIKPLKAYLTKKVKFDASLEDLITLKKFF